MSTNSRKTMKTIPFLCVCAVDRATFLILDNVVPCSYTSPPLPPTLVESAVRFGTLKCEDLYQGTTNSFILPQMSTLAKLAVILKRFVPKFTNQYVMWTDRHASSTHMFKTANPPGRASSLDVTP